MLKNNLLAYNLKRLEETLFPLVVFAFATQMDVHGIGVFLACCLHCTLTEDVPIHKKDIRLFYVGAVFLFYIFHILLPLYLSLGEALSCFVFLRTIYTIKSFKDTRGEGLFTGEKKSKNIGSLALEFLLILGITWLIFTRMTAFSKEHIFLIGLLCYVIVGVIYKIMQKNGTAQGKCAKFYPIHMTVLSACIFVVAIIVQGI